MKWLADNWRLVIVGIVLSLLSLLAILAMSNQSLRHDREELSNANAKLSGQLEWQNKTQKAVTAIDETRTKELNDAKNQIAGLQRDVATGARKLRVSATCEPSATSGMADASGPRLTDTATRNYFTLRERIATSDKQIAGLQDYIRNVCLAQ
jgi:prophage endopeptidase